MTHCGHDGGRGIGAGHVCRCIRESGHPLDDDRPHGCECGALWASAPDLLQRLADSFQTEQSDEQERD